ncbi:hypothetical protein M513_02523, partial [Trichuris suis]
MSSATSGKILAVAFVLRVVIRMVASEIDYYGILGVDKNANEQQIRRAFKKLALTMHPDKRKDDPNAQEKFIQINEAYEVLKDVHKRKLYDDHGKKGLKDYDNVFWWSKEAPAFDFALFHHHPKITVLSESNFDALVTERGTRWFVFFFSPLCSDCNQHAPLWLRVANRFGETLRVAVLNCLRNNYYCSRLDIAWYPMYKMYPEDKHFTGDPSFIALSDFANEFLEKDIVKLSYEKLIDDQDVSFYKKSRKAALVAFCSPSHLCLDMDSLLRLSSLLQPMAFVAEADCNEDAALCDHLKFSSGLAFYPSGLRRLDEAFSISNTQNPVEIADEIIRTITLKFEISEQNLSLLLERKPTEQPVVIILEDQANQEAETIRMKAAMIFENIPYKWFNCQKSLATCNMVHIQEYPHIVICKPVGGYEIYHGKLIAENVVSLVKSSLENNLITLTPEDLKLLNVDSETWLIIFTAPADTAKEKPFLCTCFNCEKRMLLFQWCPPCVLALPQLHQAAKAFRDGLRIGSFDCDVYKGSCTEMNIRHLPTFVLYNETKPYSISGYQDAASIADFVSDVLSPLVLQITERFLIHNILKGRDNFAWLIAYMWSEGAHSDFPSEYRKLARLAKGISHVKIAAIHCAVHKKLCDSRNIRAYPSIHLHLPVNRHEHYVFLNRNANTDYLLSWLRVAILPDVSQLLTETNFTQTVTNGHTWLVLFCEPWLRTCLDFEPEFKDAIRELEQFHLSFGKVNCLEDLVLCNELSITNFPTLLLYPAKYSFAEDEDIPVGKSIEERFGPLIAHELAVGIAAWFRRWSLAGKQYLNWCYSMNRSNGNRSNRRVRRAPVYWSLFDDLFEAWKSNRRDERAQEESARSVPTIVEPPEPYIESLPMELLPLIFEQIEKPMWMRLSTVNRSFRRAVINCLMNVPILDVSEFLSPAFAIESEEAVVFLLSNAISAECLKLSSNILRVLREPVVDRICALRNVRKLHIPGCFVTCVHFCEMLAHLPDLEELCMRRVTVTSKEIDFAGRRDSPLIRHLYDEVSGENTFDPPEQLTEAAIHQLASMRHLKKLDISCCAISGELLAQLLCALPQLEELIMDGSNKEAAWNREIVCEGLQALTKLKSFSISGNTRMEGEWMLNMQLGNVEKLSLLDCFVIEMTTVSTVIGKCSSLAELHFKLGQRFNDLAFPPISVITGSIRNAHLLKRLSLFNLCVDTNISDFFCRCIQLEELTIDPYEFHAGHYYYHVVLRRKVGANILEVPPQLFETLTLRPEPYWLHQVEVRLSEAIEHPYEGLSAFSRIPSSWPTREYEVAVKNMLSSLSSLTELRTLKIVSMARFEYLSKSIDSEVLGRLDVFAVWFPMHFPVDLMEAEVQELCIRFCGYA